MTKKPEEDQSKPENESEDFYFENGFMVFTKKHHLKRGYCCKNGCRHCPWDFKKKTENG